MIRIGKTVWAFAEWRAMGYPEPPTREQTQRLKSASLNTRIWTCRANEKGELLLEIELQPWTVLHIMEIEG